MRNRIVKDSIAGLVVCCFQLIRIADAQPVGSCAVPPVDKPDKLLLKTLNEICQELPYRNDIRLIPCTEIRSFYAEYKIDKVSSYLNSKIIFYNLGYFEHFSKQIDLRVVAIAFLSHELYHLFKADPQRGNVSVDDKRDFELDADRFAGSILRKMKVSELVLEKLLNRWKEVEGKVEEKDQGDYPLMKFRVEAMKNGYNDIVNFENTKYQIQQSVTKEAKAALVKIEQFAGKDTVQTITGRIVKLGEMIPKYPDCYLAYYILGSYQLSLHQFYRQGQYKMKDTATLLRKSIENFRAALSFKFSYPEASYKYCLALMLEAAEARKGKSYEKAYDEATKAILLGGGNDSVNGQFFLIMAQALGAMSKFSEATVILSGMESRTGLLAPCTENTPACISRRILALQAGGQEKKGF